MRRHRALSVLRMFIAAALSWSSAAANAQLTVDPAYVYLLLRAGGNTPVQLESDLPATLSDDYQSYAELPGWTIERQSVAVAETFGGPLPLPQAVATASATVTTTFVQSQEPGDRSFGATATALAESRLAFSVSITPLQPAPAGPTPSAFPVNVIWRAEANVTGDVNETTNASFLSGNTAEVTLSLPGGFELYHKSDPQSPSFSADGVLQASIHSPIDPIYVGLRTRVVVNPWQRDVGFGKTTNMESQAIADPAFVFDQQRFDELAAEEGFTPHRMDEYYALVFSPGIVPEPGLALLQASGLVGLVVLARWRRRS